MQNQYFEYADVFSEMDTLPPVKEGKLTDLLYESAVQRNIPMENALNEWMRWNIELFDVKYFMDGAERYLEHFSDFQKRDPDYFNFTTEWFKQVKKKWHGCGEVFDVFGQTYEANFQSAMKAAKSGQFFTPLDLCKLIAACIMPESVNDEFVYFNDCCCGSGRMLLAGIGKVKDGQHAFYEAGDLDMSSVMMTALNLMAHNAHGIVVCQDALMLSKPTCILLVNEVDYPKPSGMISLRNLSVEEAIKVGWLVKDTVEGFDTYRVVNGIYEKRYKQNK